MANRDTSIALRIRHAVGTYWIKKKWAVQFEVGLNRSGRLRADLIAVNMGSDIAIVEIKSSVADFKSDHKYPKYRLFSDKLYFAFEQTTYLKVRDLIPKGIGIMVVKNNALKIVQVATYNECNAKKRLSVITRMAYRGAAMNAKTHKNKVDVAQMVSCDVENHINNKYPKMPSRATKSIKETIESSLKIHTNIKG